MTDPIEQATQGVVRTVDSGDVQLQVTCHGEPYNATILFVHGYPDHSEVWQPIVNILKDHYHVVTYDVRGCGQSTQPGWMWDYSLNNLSQDLQAVMRAVCPVEPVHLVAHDWGSIQTWESVTDHRLKTRIASFTSISGPCLDHVGHWMRTGLSSKEPGQIAKVAGQLLSSWYIAAFQLPILAPSAWRLGLSKMWPKVLKRMENFEVDATETQLRDGVNGINLYRANMLPRLLSPRVRKTEVPVQLLVPLQDNFVTPQLVECCYPFVQGLWRRDLDAGHWCLQYESEYVANCIAEFVEFAKTGRENPSLAKARVQ